MRDIKPESDVNKKKEYWYSNLGRKFLDNIFQSLIIILFILIILVLLQQNKIQSQPDLCPRNTNTGFLDSKLNISVKNFSFFFCSSKLGKFHHKYNLFKIQ